MGYLANKVVLGGSSLSTAVFFISVLMPLMLHTPACCIQKMDNGPVHLRLQFLDTQPPTILRVTMEVGSEDDFARQGTKHWLVGF